jgi:hypothetical protein
MSSVGCGWRLLVAAVDIAGLTNELPFSSQKRAFCFQKTFEAIDCAKELLGFAKATNFAMILGHMGTIFVIFLRYFFDSFWQPSATGAGSCLSKYDTIFILLGDMT